MQIINLLIMQVFLYLVVQWFWFRLPIVILFFFIWTLKAIYLAFINAILYELN